MPALFGSILCDACKTGSGGLRGWVTRADIVPQKVVLPPLFRVTPGFMDRVVTMVTAPKIYPELWILEALAVDWNTFGYG